VPRILLASDQYEALYPALVKFGSRLRVEADGVNMETFSEPGAHRINPVTDLAAVGDGPGPGSKRILSWVADVVLQPNH
jgi:hypothetical protein